MKLQDIRIGSYIRGYYDEGNEHKYRDFKVVNILGILEEVESEEGDIFFIDDCDGIPLTDEVLTEIGFIRRRSTYTYMQSGHYLISIYYGQDLSITETNRDFMQLFMQHKAKWHFHQLQNVLWDCELYDIADKLKIEEQ